MSAADVACPGCQANGWDEEVCFHSPEFFPVAQAIGRAIHGDDATDEQAGWFTDDAEQIALDLMRLLDGQTPTARNLGTVGSDYDRIALLFNDRYVVTILGSNDGSGETITEVVADLLGSPA